MLSILNMFSILAFSCACSLNRIFRARAALFDHTVRGALSPPHNSRALGSVTQGHARDRDLRAALGNPQDKRPIRQANSGRSVRVATSPEIQAAPYRIFNLPRRLSSPSHDSADRRLRPAIVPVYVCDRQHATTQSNRIFFTRLQFL